MIKRTILYFLLFVAIGELMIRIDKEFSVLKSNTIVKISTNIEITPEFKMLKNNTFSFNKNDLRIMVIGDSYIHGGGIDFKDNFSQQLKKIFKNKIDNQNKIWVLDVSKPSSNNYDNNKTYFQYVDVFKPNIIILGYNINDVNGNLNTKDNFNKTKNSTNTKKTRREAETLIKKIYRIVYKSKVIHFAMHKIHNELKNIGIIIPYSNFDLTIKSYYQNKDSWIKSKVLLTEIINDVRKRKSQLIVYKFPEFNLLEYPILFEKANNIIAEFFSKYNFVIYKNGRLCFSGEKSEKYILSKYDGHPNAKAHNKIAKDVYEIIKKNNKMPNFNLDSDL